MSTVAVVTATGRRVVDLDGLLDAEAAERAEVEANRWIKSLRHARVDGATLRDRFTHRGDSLWWFAEIYLHRMRVVTRAHRAIAALERLADDGPGARWILDGSDHVAGLIARQVAARWRIPCDGPADARPQRRGTSARAKALFHTATAMADRLRPTPSPRTGRSPVVAFVHAAFAGVLTRATRPTWAL